MEYRKLPRSDLSVSRIGFGAMSLTSDGTDHDMLLQRALDGGINYFDTADMYQQGANESTLGRAFRNRRNEVIIATKVGNRWRPDGSGWDWVPSKEYILSAAEQSLIRLQTDYIDLYQLHGGTLEDPIDDIIEAFEILRGQGKIRYYGISSIRPNVIREYVKRSAIMSVMMQYSLLDRRPEEALLHFLAEHQIAVLARGAIAKGLLVSKEARPFLNYSEEQVAAAASAVKTVSGKSRDPLETAIQYVLQQTAVSSAIIGIRNSEQLRAVLSIGETQLNEKEMQCLSEAIPANYYSEHR